jgi:3-hydroxymyristoyl/3-hydroxydecanoyl-(acyl carrier protein) dehydratase
LASKKFIVDPASLDFDQVLADAEQIRKINPQRYEMEQLTAVIIEDVASLTCVGYKDVGPDEWWVRGHMPGMPLMPGVLMCEAAAQLCSYFAVHHDLLGADLVGFGGMEDVRFRDPVVPGDRLVIACVQEKVRRGRMIVCRFQGMVRDAIVVEGTIKGIPLPTEVLKNYMNDRS